VLKVNKKANSVLYFVLIVLILVVLFKFMGTGSMSREEISFVYDGIDGVGYYEFGNFGNKEGSAGSSLVVDDRLEISASSSGSTYGAPSTSAKYELYIGELYNFCAGGFLSKGRRDDRVGNGIKLVGSGVSVPLFSVRSVGEAGGKWTDFKCFDLKFEYVDNDKFLVVNDGFDVEWIKVNGMPDDGLILSGNVETKADHHSGCSTEIYISNLEPVDGVVEPVNPDVIDEDLPIENFFDGFRSWIGDILKEFLSMFKISFVPKGTGGLE